MVAAPETRRFGIDPRSGKLMLGPWGIPMPRSRAGRIGLGSALMVGGTLGFLPILGFWMLPVGFLVLSNDVPFVRRRRRRFAIWWARRRRPASPSSAAEPDVHTSSQAGAAPEYPDTSALRRLKRLG
jgi:hypothetical protein